jgi:hypothetical protein
MNPVVFLRECMVRSLRVTHVRGRRDVVHVVQRYDVVFRRAHCHL